MQTSERQEAKGNSLDSTELGLGLLAQLNSGLGSREIFEKDRLSSTRYSTDEESFEGSLLNSCERNQQQRFLDRNGKTGQFQSSRKYKTEICKNYQLNRVCKWGANCCFAHGKFELRSKEALNYYYKTKVCKHYHKTGFCPYASRCQYFHFKGHKIFQELLDSLEKKLKMRLNLGESTSFVSLLEKHELVHSRLPIFKAIYKGEEKKSLYENFLENRY